MNRNRIIAGISLVFLPIYLTGCATIISGSRQNISFETTPQGAFVQVEDPGGFFTFSSCETPCSISLNRREKHYRVRITKKGYQTYTLALERETNDWIWGNFIPGGIIVDLITGAWYRLTPGILDETLTPSQSSEIQNDGNITLVIIDMQSLTPEQKASVAQGEKIELLPEPTNSAR